MIQKAAFQQIIKKVIAQLNLGDIILVLDLEITELRETLDVIP